MVAAVADLPAVGAIPDDPPPRRLVGAGVTQHDAGQVGSQEANGRVTDELEQRLLVEHRRAAPHQRRERIRLCGPQLGARERPHRVERRRHLRRDQLEQVDLVGREVGSE